MINLAIAGAAGRMGQAIIRELQSVEGIRVSVALEHKSSECLGQDAGLTAGIEELGVVISDAIEEADFDVMVDFTRPEPTMEHLAMCLEKEAGMMIGTTGLDQAQKQRIADAGQEIPVLLAANTSVGVNLCVALIETASRVLGEVVDIEVIESHHRHKVDAPSGTALLLGEAAARTLGRDLQKDGVFARHGHTGERTDGAIGFSTIRGGDIAGEHTVMFIGESERVEITHKATDRKIFARGAVRAAQWLSAQEKGFYDMRDALGLNTTGG